MIALGILSCTKPKPRASNSSAQIHQNDPYQGGKNSPLISLSTLLKHHRENFVFRTDAIVDYIYQCPPCPKGARCKLCMENHVVISEDNGIFNSFDDLNSSRMIVGLDDPEKLELHQKYRFQIQYQSVDFDQQKRTIWKGQLLNFEKL